MDALARRAWRGVVTLGPTAEYERSQQCIQAITSVLLLGMYIVAGLDHHGGWSTPLDWTTEAAGDALFVAGFGVIFLALRENSHAAATVQVEADQRGALLLFLGTPPRAGLLVGLSAGARPVGRRGRPSPR